MFLKGISEGLANCLKMLGIEVVGEIHSMPLQNPFCSDSDLEVSSDESSSESTENLKPKVQRPPFQSSKCVNLDVTALIAYVSSTANGGSNFIFKDKFLTEQAEMERANPVKETLQEYFRGNLRKMRIFMQVFLMEYML